MTGPVLIVAGAQTGAELETVHAVTVTATRIECLPGCFGKAPHLAEYRALDVNPNR